MARPIQYARRANGVPFVRSGKYKTGEAIVFGSLLTVDTNGELTLHGGATAVDVVGIALEAAGSRPGYDMGHTPIVVTGRKQEISFIQADAETVFSAQLCTDSTGATLVTAAQTHIGEEYGVAKDASGQWLVDTSETTTKVFEIVDIDTDLNVVYVKFMAAALDVGV